MPPLRRALDLIVTRDPELDALRRAAAGRYGDPDRGGASASPSWVPVQTPLFTIFGSVALLIVADFPGNRAGPRRRLRRTGSQRRRPDHAGHAGGAHPWLSVAMMFVLGVAVTFAGVLSATIAAAQRATLLTFVLPACTPPGPIAERLLGW